MSGNKCALEGCKKRTNLIGFDCKCCNKRYCVQHRLFEEHGCENKVREDAYQANKHNLLKNAMSDTHHYIKL
jgi:hypothetical protein